MAHQRLGAGEAGEVDVRVAQQLDDERRLRRGHEEGGIDHLVAQRVGGHTAGVLVELGGRLVHAIGLQQLHRRDMGAAALRTHRDALAAQTAQIGDRFGAVGEEPDGLVEHVPQGHQVLRARNLRQAALEERHVDAGFRVDQPLQVVDRAIRNPKFEFDAVLGQCRLVLRTEGRIAAIGLAGGHHQLARRAGLPEGEGRPQRTEDQQGDHPGHPALRQRRGFETLEGVRRRGGCCRQRGAHGRGGVAGQRTRQRARRGVDRSLARPWGRCLQRHGVLRAMGRKKVYLTAGGHPGPVPRTTRHSGSQVRSRSFPAPSRVASPAPRSDAFATAPAPDSWHRSARPGARR